jgi:Methyltransferase domain
VITSFWNDRYSEKEYVYGEAPNVFFAAQLNALPTGTIILPCEGEGRNAVYAAAKGWEVNAFDSSEAGKIKALQLAEKNNVAVNYVIEDAALVSYPAGSADVVAFIYAHFQPSIRTQIHQKAIEWLKPGGKIIMEAFNPQQLKNNSGGPKDVSMLYTEAILKEDFPDLKIELLQTVQTILSEGKYHEGIADIIQFTGVKI